MRLRLPLHGRSHVPTGSDPLPRAIFFDYPNSDDWLQIEVTGGSPTTFLGANFIVHPSAGGGFTITNGDAPGESFSFGGGVSWQTNGAGISIDTTSGSGNGGATFSTGSVSWTADSYTWLIRPTGSFDVGGGTINLGTSGGEDVNIVPNSGRVGFFGAGPVGQQATPVTLGDVIALLQAYGLSA